MINTDESTAVLLENKTFAFLRQDNLFKRTGGEKSLLVASKSKQEAADILVNTFLILSMLKTQIRDVMAQRKQTQLHLSPPTENHDCMNM